MNAPLSSVNLHGGVCGGGGVRVGGQISYWNVLILSLDHPWKDVKLVKYEEKI